MSLKTTFRSGGVHPSGRKGKTKNKELKNSFLPGTAIVPLSQHIGAAATCLVEVGDSVKEEMLIGKAAGFISANIHSPVPGTVREIKKIFLPNGTETQAVFIEMEGEFKRLGRKKEGKSWQDLSSKQILEKIAEKGVVGLGGATFPAHVKYTLPEGAKAEYLIINGAECEPYLTADDHLMKKKAREIIEGIQIIRSVIKPEKCVIGIENNKPEAIAVFKKEINNSLLDIDVVDLQLRYPQGDEKMLIQAITGREVPSGRLPIDIGVVVSNVGTLYSIYEAVVFDKPVIERLVTISGGGVKKPQTLRVRIGTPIKDVIEECGGLNKKTERIIAGGPMMGFSLYDLETPVIKGTSGILALTAGEVKKGQETNCIACGRCVEACPVGLEPTLLYKYIDHQNVDAAKEHGVLDCRECGCCGYVCPARLQLVQGMRLGKRILRNKKG